MAKIPEQKYDFTLTKIKENIEKQYNESFVPRKYLGMSQIGEECWRKLFYSYRQAAKQEVKSELIFAREDGYEQERIMAMRIIEYHEDIKLITHDENGHQIKFNDFNCHFTGHCDGIIQGIIESKQKHIWEHKSVDQKKFNRLIKIREKFGEKQSLKEWDIIYYDQAISYMHYAALKDHFLTVSTPGGRDFISIRTKYDNKYARNIIEKADAIINDNWYIPAKLSDDAEFYKCKWCTYQDVCHYGYFPEINCRTCRYSKPVQNGNFDCLKTNKQINDIFSSCDLHIYNPALIDSMCLEHVESGVVYKKDGLIWANYDKTGFPSDEKISTFYTSQELYENVKTINNIKAEIIKKEFNCKEIKNKNGLKV